MDYQQKSHNKIINEICEMSEEDLKARMAFQSATSGMQDRHSTNRGQNNNMYIHIFIVYNKVQVKTCSFLEAVLTMCTVEDGTDAMLYSYSTRVSEQ